MAKQNEHGRLIAAAAKAALGPLGCRRVGQSRCWISDERFWIIFVEFQPSAWSKGSYLNVGPRWLWLRFGSGELSCRPADFIPFESAEQFTPLVVHMAKCAVEEILALRAKFRTPEDVHRYFVGRISRDGFPVYRAAITAGLAGDIATARQLFKRMETWDTENHVSWIRVKTECAALAALLDDPRQYRSAMLDTIALRRQQLKLPADPACLESMDSIAEA